MHTAKLAAALLVLLALVLGTGLARAETVNCAPIQSVPFTITAEGVYCLTGPIGTAMASGNAIDIQAHNVVVDLNGFKLGNLAAGPDTGANGIRASDRQNITIRNGTIRGFHQAIVLLDVFGVSQAHLVKDIRADQSTEVGIRVEGDGTIIRHTTSCRREGRRDTGRMPTPLGSTWSAPVCGCSTTTSSPPRRRGRGRRRASCSPGLAVAWP